MEVVKSKQELLSNDDSCGEMEERCDRCRWKKKRGGDLPGGQGNPR